MRSKTLLTAITSILTLCSTAQADALYRWTDAQGKVHFSSKKPESGGAVESFKGEPISRYSAKQKNKNIQAVVDSAKAPLKSFNSDQALGKLETPLPPPSLVGLIQQELKVEHGASGEITDCRMTLWNNAPTATTGVSVIFKFGEGTELPAVGPTEIPPQGKADYAAPADNLPIVLPGGIGSTPEVVVKQKS